MQSFLAEGVRLQVVKRLIDIAASAAGLLLLSPLLAVVALVSRATLGPGVLFIQPRVGQGGRIFDIYKFRTMTSGDAPAADLSSDERRLTRWGSFLRQWSIDELPGLFNVLRGDMSLVGPRPLLVEYLPLYTAEQARRHEVLPGITGWAQVNGRNAVSWEEKFRLDVWYVDNRSLVLDFRILAMTAAKVLRRDGISQAGHATTEPFRGSAPEESSAATPAEPPRKDPDAAS